MGILNKLFGKADEPIRTYADFWAWFVQHEKKFFKVMQRHDDIERDFFDKVSPKLEELHEGMLLLAGMLDDQTADLIFTVDGDVKQIAFAEDLAQAAPVIPGWKISALKPPISLDNMQIKMNDCVFDSETLSFYYDQNPSYPDEVDITVVHRDQTKENSEAIASGIYLFLDNYLGELNFVEDVDLFKIVAPSEVEKELVPMGKLKDFLIWRKKEFVEKYEGVWYRTEDDDYSAMEGELENGKPLIAIINSTLLEWDRKASHPWVVRLDIAYKGDSDDNMPDEATYELMNQIEEQVTAELKDYEGYLNVGRQTADGLREIYFACKDFRKPSKVLYALVESYEGEMELSYDIYKDKYWQTFERFRG